MQLLRSARVRHFASFATLSPAEAKLIDDVAQSPKQRHEAGAVLGPKGKLLCSGWMAHERLLSGDRRQLVQLAVEGGPLPCDDGLAEQSCTALVDSLTVDTSRILLAARDPAVYPGIAKALRRMRSEQSFFAREQIARLGPMDAIERMASLLLEIVYRRRHEDAVIEIPLTQQHYADLLGLSTVHINRTLREMREQGLVEQRRHALRLLRPDRLKELASFATPVFEDRHSD